jgi:hypothetical protein
VIKWTKIRWTGHVTRTEKCDDITGFWSLTLKGRGYVGNLSVILNKWGLTVRTGANFLKIDWDFRCSRRRLWVVMGCRAVKSRGNWPTLQGCLLPKNLWNVGQFLRDYTRNNPEVSHLHAQVEFNDGLLWILWWIFVFHQGAKMFNKQIHFKIFTNHPVTWSYLVIILRDYKQTHFLSG